MTIKVSKSPSWVAGQGTKLSGNPANGGLKVPAAAAINYITFEINGSTLVSLDPASAPALPSLTNLSNSLPVSLLSSATLSYTSPSGYPIRVTLESDGGATPHTMSPSFNLKAYYMSAGVPTANAVSGSDVIYLQQDSGSGWQTIAGFSIFNVTVGGGKG